LDPVRNNATDGDDLEPEFVDINKKNKAVVTFQENNWLAIVDLKTGQTINHFSAGEVDLKNVDNVEEDPPLIILDTDITKRREPDAVAWIDYDSFATANECDYEDGSGEEGGSRGFTIFNIDGTVEFESEESFEHWLVSAGHYLDGRSENKGCEPEGIAAGRFGFRTFLFVGAERCNAVGVYDVTSGTPKPIQILPTGIKPEGLKTFSKSWFGWFFNKRNLFAVSTEDNEDDIPTMINIYRMEYGPSYYPMIVSGDDSNGLPIPWVGLSGLGADPTTPKKLYTVSDSFLQKAFFYEIDASSHPAVIVDRKEVTGASADLDLEGIAVGPDGNLWIASEGNSSTRPNLVLKVNPATGAVISEFPLPTAPDDMTDNRRGNGFEGIAVTGTAGNEVVYAVIQRAWPNEGDTDEVNTKIGRLDPSTGDWDFVHYPLEPEGKGDWIGLSALTQLPNGKFAVIERDKGWGPTTGFIAEIKRIYQVDLDAATFHPYSEPQAPPLELLSKTLVRDVLPDLQATSIWTAEKLEGLTVDANGDVFVLVDNDGVDDATGETLFLNLGDWESAFNLP